MRSLRDHVKTKTALNKRRERDSNPVSRLKPTHRISNPETDCHNQQEPQQVTETTNSVLPSGLPDSVPIDPDLAAVVEAWPKLPEAIKAGILAMIRAAGGAG